MALAAALPKVDDPKGDDCGVVVCPNANENPEAGVPLGVVVVAAGVLDCLFAENEKLGVVLVLVVLPALTLGALVDELGVKVPFPNTALLGVSVELLPNTLPPNMFGV